MVCWPQVFFAAEPASKPNFLVIVADDMGFSDTGCYGGEIATPNLDRLAANGLRYSQFYSTARCWPSRACILTGYYAQQVRMDPPQGPLPAWTRVLPHYFKPAGYRSYHAGKWHLMGAAKRLADGGFDRSYSIEDHDRHFAPKNALLDDQPLPPVKASDGYFSATGTANYAIEFLKEHQTRYGRQPFILYLAFITPHFPLQAPPQVIARYQDRYYDGWDVVRQQRWQRVTSMGLANHALPPLEPNFLAPWSLSEAKLQEQIGPGESGIAMPWNALTVEQKNFQAAKMAVHAAMIDQMDREIGRVLAQVKAMGQDRNTVTFFMSDNGTTAEQIIRGDRHSTNAAPGSAASYLCLGPGWSSAGNAPFRLHKHWVHEGGISSPLIVHWPAGLKAKGEIRHNPGHFVDVLPTMLELAGIQPETAWRGENPPPLPGRSLVPSFSRDHSVARDFIYFHHQGNRALRAGDLKLVSAGTNGGWELYNLKTDRAEQHNLAGDQPQKVQELVELWQRTDALYKQQAGPPPAAQAGKKAAPKK
jgi:arylsulfatase